MADNVVSDNNEKSLYLMQIEYLEEQLERSQLKCDELEEQNRDLFSQYSALEKDKKDITDYLKRSVAVKEKKVDELEEQLESQRRAAERDREALNLQQNQQMQKLQEQISKLNSQSMTQAAKIEDLKAPLIQLVQQLQYVESVEKQLVAQEEEHKAAIHNLKMEAALEKAKLLKVLHYNVNASDRSEILDILENERAEHRKYKEQLHFLHSETTRLQEEKEAIQDEQRDLCVQRDNLKKDLKKIKQENITYRKEVKQLSDNCEQLKVEIKECRVTHRHKMAHLKGLRQRVDPLVKECREKAEEANQLGPEIQEERTGQRRLECVMQEAAIVLRHILDSDKAHETECKMQRLSEILESTAPQGTAPTLSESTENNVRGQKPQTSSLTLVRKLCSKKTSTAVDPSDLAPLLTYSEAEAPTSAGYLTRFSQHEERRSCEQAAGAAADVWKHRRNTTVVETKHLQPSDSDKMELYLDLISQPCRAVFLFVKVTGIPFEFKLVDLAAGHQHSEEFGKLSAVRKVPVMKDGSFILKESVAILKYMAQKYSSSVADHWYPADLQQRARVNEYLAWQHTNLRFYGSKIFLFRSVFPLIMGFEAPKEKTDAVLEDLNKSLKLLEETFLQKKPFIVGDKISLADLVAIVEIMQPVGTGLDVFEGRPKLIAWRERVKKALGTKLFDEAHEAIMNVSKLPQKMQDKSRLEMLKPRFQKMLS